ncbi:structural protein [Emticicia sp. BO119]|uniref:structural protein n=1 Tax=Emticicia sp. BO119 TaxID=2757768 RepID=UPI0015F12443|nr:structural protein [Emticicia sp. BO119]MBA4849486.1 structural protein [Emticicia sp. BO119]
MRKPQLTQFRKHNQRSIITLIVGSILFLWVLISQLPPVKDSKQKSYLGQANLPRGVRNNNPGNIRYNPANAWKGKIPLTQKSDLAFEEFIEYRYGVRALLILLKNFIFSYGTIEKIISRYAPANENETERYVRAVAAETGIPRDQALTSTQETLRKLSIAITRQEVGNGYEISNEDFLNAYNII